MCLGLEAEPQAAGGTGVWGRTPALENFAFSKKSRGNFMKTFFWMTPEFLQKNLRCFCAKTLFFVENTCALCSWSLALSIPVLGLESVCPRKVGPWPWLWPRPRIFCVRGLGLEPCVLDSTSDGHTVANGSPPLQHFFEKRCVVCKQACGQKSYGVIKMRMKKNILFMEKKKRTKVEKDGRITDTL